MLKQLFVVSRPVSWLNTAYPFAAGYFVLQPSVDLLFIVGTLFFLIPYNLLMYGVNDVYDYESDIRNPRKGGMEGAKSAKALHRPILIAATLTTVPFLIALLILGNPLANLTLAIVVFFVLAYSIKGLRFKEIPLLDSVTSSIHFVGPLVYALTLVGFETEAWPLLLAFFLWGMASHAFGAVQDIIADREGGLASIATILGAKRTVRFAAVLYLLSSVILISHSTPAAIVGVVGLIYVANIAPYLSISDAQAERANTAWRRFIFLNLATGFAVTMALLYVFLPR